MLKYFKTKFCDISVIVYTSNRYLTDFELVEYAEWWLFSTVVTKAGIDIAGDGKSHCKFSNMDIVI